MDLSKTLVQLNKQLGPRQVQMTKSQFEAYAEGQLAKAKDEEKEGDEGKKKATKRLNHLRSVISVVTKESYAPEQLFGGLDQWSGDNATALIPVYDGGFEDTTNKTERTEQELNAATLGGSGTQGDGASPYSNGAADFTGVVGGNPAGNTFQNEIGVAGDSLLGGTGTQGDTDGSAYSNGGDVWKQLNSIAKGEPASAPTKKAAEEPFAWPKDIAHDVRRERAIAAKRAPADEESWGKDSEQ